MKILKDLEAISGNILPYGDNVSRKTYFIMTIQEESFGLYKAKTSNTDSFFHLFHVHVFLLYSLAFYLCHPRTDLFHKSALPHWPFDTCN